MLFSQHLETCKAVLLCNCSCRRFCSAPLWPGGCQDCLQIHHCPVWFVASLVQTRIQPLTHDPLSAAAADRNCWCQSHLPHSGLKMEQQDLKAGQGWVLELGNETELSGTGQRACWCIQAHLKLLGKWQCSVLQADKHCWDLWFVRFNHTTPQINATPRDKLLKEVSFLTEIQMIFYAATCAPPNITKPVLTLASQASPVGEE